MSVSPPVKLHRPPAPPAFVPPPEVPFVMHYAPHGSPDATGRVRALGTRACDGGPMADLKNVDAAIRLFADADVYVAPRWASANVPGSVTCEACMATEAFARALLAAGGGPAEATDPSAGGVFANPGLIDVPDDLGNISNIGGK